MNINNINNKCLVLNKNIGNKSVGIIKYGKNKGKNLIFTFNKKKGQSKTKTNNSKNISNNINDNPEKQININQSNNINSNISNDNTLNSNSHSHICLIPNNSINKDNIIKKDFMERNYPNSNITF